MSSWYIVKRGHTLLDNDKVYGYGAQITAKQAARMPGLVSTEDPNRPKVEAVPQVEEVPQREEEKVSIPVAPPATRLTASK